MRTFILGCILLFFAGNAHPKKEGKDAIFYQASLTGFYQGIGDLYLVDHGVSIAGYYQSYRAETFSTLFFVVGERKKGARGSYNIRTFYPPANDTIRGSLKIINDKEIEVNLDRIPDGGEFGLNKVSDTFEKLAVGSWRGVGYISVARSSFGKFESDTSSSRYLVKYDPVLIPTIAAAKRSGKIEVSYISKDKLVKGWVSSGSIVKLRP